jgi:spore germination protein GerM
MKMRGALILAVVVGAGVWMRTVSPVVVPRALASWWPSGGASIVTLYFSDEADIFPVSHRLAAAGDLPRATLQALLDGPPAGSGLTSVIPTAAGVRSLSVANGTARIDLSIPDATLDTRARTAIVDTMTALPGIRLVELQVNGGRPAPPAARTPLLYYASASGLVALPVSTAATGRDAIAAYLAGPSDPLLSGLPRDVRLEQFEDDAAGGVSLRFTYTDSIRTLAIERPHIMRSVLLGLIASLTEVPGITTVRIDFDGRTQLGLGECSDLLRTPQPHPRLLNDERLLGS